MTVAEAPFATRISLTNSNLLVRYTEVPEKSRGGIYLPESCRVNIQEAEVLAAGPGYLWPGDWRRSVVHVKPGDVVLFPPNAFQPTGEQEGIVREEELYAIVQHDNSLFPLNDWVTVKLEEWEREAGSLVLPEESQHRPNNGIATMCGPGRLILNERSPRYGTRLSVTEILGLRDEEFVAGLDSLLGKRVWWDRTENVCEAGDEWVSTVMVPAGDLCVIREIEHEGDEPLR